ncbi:MAG: EI24 domain-containing protein [Alphaproteobacteria bacterium]|nr:EI24 domain-containing protein [Alphaproteobacteria bacterium]MCB9699189.1 EI24 domain-containing protein [Alphaproteobacteria bacterium]
MRYSAPDLDTVSLPGRFLWGARYALYGARIVVTHPSLWWTVIVPVFLTLMMFVLGFWSIGVLLPWLTTFVWVPGPHHAKWIWIAYEIVLWTFRLSVAVALGVLLYFTAGLVATPFNDRLSERVERVVLGWRGETVSLGQMLRDLWWSFVHSVLSLVVYLAVLFVAFLLNLLPGIGSVASFLLGSIASGLFFTREAMDGSFSRRRMSYRYKWRVVLRHWPMALGFGLCVSLAMWVPFFNFLVLPMSVAGGTLMYCHLEAAGQLPSE